MTTRLLRSALVLAATVLLVTPAVASGAKDMEVGIADENVLNGSSPGGADATVAKWKASGVDDVRVFAQWDKFAPATQETKAPAGFVASNPASYDLSALDRKIDVVVKHGLNVTLVITGPGPVWGSSEAARRNGAWKPDPTKFRDYATAITKHVAARVDRYIVWNEPNVKTWLQPQYVCVTKKGARPPVDCRSVAPHLYRDLARAGYSAIHAADPQARVALGGTSSFGQEFPTSTNSVTTPLGFLRSLACVDGKYRSIRTGSCKGFKPLTAEAYAYHPHSTRLSPGQADSNPNNARIADLPRVTTALDRLASRNRLKVAGQAKMPLWLDEYGYQTNPPDEKDGFQSPSLAAAYLQWGWSIAARNPRVETLTQYEWFDEALGEGDKQFNRWQSGLYTFDGKPKPLAAVFANPIFGWRTSKAAYVWGHVRPGDGATTVRLQRRNGSSFQDYKTVGTDANGIFQVRVPRSTTAKYRFVYVDPATRADVTSGMTALRKP